MVTTPAPHPEVALSDKERQTLMAYREEQDFERVAHRLGIKINSARRYFQRARAKLEKRGKNWKNCRISTSDTPVPFEAEEEKVLIKRTIVGGGSNLKSDKQMLEEDIKTGGASMRYKYHALGEEPKGRDGRLAMGINQLGYKKYKQKQNIQALKELNASAHDRIVVIEEKDMTDEVKEVIKHRKITHMSTSYGDCGNTYTFEVKNDSDRVALAYALHSNQVEVDVNSEKFTILFLNGEIRLSHVIVADKAGNKESIAILECLKKADTKERFCNFCGKCYKEKVSIQWEEFDWEHIDKEDVEYVGYVVNGIELIYKI